MSTPGIAVIPSDVQEARQKALTTDFFALCYLMLSNLAYAGENKAQQAIDQIKKLLPTMPAPQGTVKGKWTLAWGPQASPDNSNLMYAAEFFDSVSGLPVFLGVGIRGTDTKAQPSAVLKQIVEDLDADHQVVFPANNQHGSKISRGSQVGLDALNGLQDPNTHQTLAAFVQGYVNRNPDVPVVVTGHSLGGCQATVVALDLAIKAPKAKVVTSTYAAPTAGNSAFIQLFEQNMARSARWVNIYDLVPKAYAELADINNLWTACHRPAPQIVKIALEGLRLVLELANVHYAQQSANDSRPCGGICQQNQPDAVSPSKENQAVAEIQEILQNAVQKVLHSGHLTEVINRVQGHSGSFSFSGIAAHLLPAGTLFEKIIEHVSISELQSWVKELLFQHSVETGYWDSVKGSKGVASIPNPFSMSAIAAPMSIAAAPAAAIVPGGGGASKI